MVTCLTILDLDVQGGLILSCSFECNFVFIVIFQELIQVFYLKPLDLGYFNIVFKF